MKTVVLFALLVICRSTDTYRFMNNLLFLAISILLGGLVSARRSNEGRQGASGGEAPCLVSGRGGASHFEAGVGLPPAVLRVLLCCSCAPDIGFLEESDEGIHDKGVKLCTCGHL